MEYLMKKKRAFIPTIIILCFAVAILFGRIVLKIGSWQYDSYDAFSEDAFIRFSVDIPKDAEDCRYFYQNLGIGKRSLYAFSLNENDYRKLVEELAAEYNLKKEPSDEKEAAYGYSKWYLMKVQDACSTEYELDDFPIHLAYDKVIDDDINDYDIILYNPVGTGSVGYGLVANPDTGRIVVFNAGNIR